MRIRASPPPLDDVCKLYVLLPLDSCDDVIQIQRFTIFSGERWTGSMLPLVVPSCLTILSHYPLSSNLTLLCLCWIYSSTRCSWILVAGGTGAPASAVRNRRAGHV
ncbi:hypothetical protein BS78_10G127800 [Paspalum vaginatum]|nr:hypothetical protein BS78_10G127800 [Paspalum vaginatum]